MIKIKKGAFGTINGNEYRVIRDEKFLGCNKSCVVNQHGQTRYFQTGKLYTLEDIDDKFQNNDFMTCNDYPLELHIWIKRPPKTSLNSYHDVCEAIKKGVNRIDTGLINFCCMDNIHIHGYTIIIHSINDGEFTITKEGCDGIVKELRVEHNLMKLLVGGCFGEMPK